MSVAVRGYMSIADSRSTALKDYNCNLLRPVHDMLTQAPVDARSCSNCCRQAAHRKQRRAAAPQFSAKTATLTVIASSDAT